MTTSHSQYELAQGARFRGRRVPPWRRVSVISLVLGLTTGMLSTAAAPTVHAGLFGPVPADAAGFPNQDFTDQQSLWAYVRSDALGGRICVVSGVGGLAGLSCDSPAPGMGKATHLLSIGTLYTLVKDAPLVPGTYRLLVENSLNEPLETSVEFFVDACGTCAKTPDAAIVANFKAAATEMAHDMNFVCKVNNQLKKVANKATGMAGFTKDITLHVKPPFSVNYELLFALGMSTEVGGAVNFTVEDPLTANINRALALLKHISCGVATMYKDQAADPPDPNFDTVLPPEFMTIEDLSPATLDTLIRSIEKEWAFGAALLHGFERYQGAAAVSNNAGEIRQLRATGENASALAREIERTQVALRSWANGAATDPELAGIAVSAADAPVLASFYARVRATGFTLDEISQFHAFGYSDADIAAIRTHATQDPSDLPVDTTYPDILRSLADGLEVQVDAYDTFASEMLVVAARLQLLPNISPIARFTTSVTGGFAPLTVAFDASSSSDPDGTVVSYSWDFGDGSPAGTGVAPSHTFTVLPVANVTLTVTDDSGATAVSGRQISLFDPAIPPSVVLVPVRRVPPGFAGSYDARPTNLNFSHPISFAFDFGDGTPVVTTASSGGPVNVLHVYDNPGIYTLAATVTNEFGLSGSTSQPVTVANVIADAGPDVTVAEGTPAALGGASVPSPNDGTAAFSWDFGDGPGGVSFGVNEPLASHTYANQGSFVATLSVADRLLPGNLPAVDATVVTVTNVAPTIVGVIHTETASPGDPVSFHVFASDPGVNDVLSAAWDFGDGTSGVGLAADHAYTSSGSYTATVTVSDGDGGTSSATRIVAIGPNVGQRDSKGREFWLAFQTNTPGLLQLSLFISSDVATSGFVEVPGIGFSTPFTVVAGVVTTVKLPGSAMMRDDSTLAFGAKQALAIHVVAQDEVSVYGLNQIFQTTDGFLGLPLDVLGTDHVIASYQGLVANGFPSELDIVATANGTTVNLSPNGDLVHAVPGPKLFQLDAGDVIQIQGADLTGSFVTSNHPVAVFGGVKCANVPTNVGACDHLTEQMPSTDLLGSRFVTVPLATRLLGDTVRIIATQATTIVSVNGTVVATLGAGGFYETVLTQASVIETSHPAMVVQYSNGQGFDQVQPADPFMMLVPPAEQFLSSYTVSTPAAGFIANFINVVAPTTALATVKVDGVTVTPTLWAPVAGTTFSGAQVPVPLGSHTVSASAPIGVFVYGFNFFESYGYPGGMQLARVGAVTNLTVAPASQTLTTGGQGCVNATVTDAASVGIADARIDFSISGANPKSSFVFTDAAGVTKICWTGVNPGTDTLTVTLGARSNTATILWSSTPPPPTNRVPQADAKSVTTLEDVAVPVLLSGSDPDGDPLTFTVVTAPAHGVLSGTGATRTYTPNANFNGSDVFTYRANDGVADSNTATVAITVSPVNVSPQLHLRKVVVNDNGGTKTVADFPLTANGTGTNDVTGTSPVDSGAGLLADTWALSETGLTGYSASSWSCVKNSGAPVTGASISLGLGDSATCTITNNDIAPQLHLRKVVVNDNGGTATVANFTLTADGAVTGNDLSGTSPVDSLGGLMADTWALSESGPAGYSNAGWVCVGGTQVNSNITVSIGGDATCTITNNDNSAHLQLVKSVTNDNGGAAPAGAWNLTADGTAANDISGAGGFNQDVNADTYALSESTGPAGYSAGSWSCTKNSGAPVTGASISLALGESAVCTINNNDIAPQLHLRKVVVNDNGGTKTVADFPLTANGTGTNDVTGTSPVDSGAGLLADTWALSETGLTGYSASSWSCVKNSGAPVTGASISLGLGDSATCTITNNDIAPQLHLRKVVVNDNGGTATVANFTLTADGAVTGNDVSGTSPVDSLGGLMADTWALSETGLTGYSASSWSCIGGTQSNSNITVDIGGSATCTITNNDIQPKLTLVKTVINDNGGTKTVADFPLLVNTTGVTSGVSNGFNAGTYTASETSLSSYTASVWGGACAASGSVTLSVGDNKTCTITNNDKPGTIIVSKIAKPAQGSFSFTATTSDGSNPTLAAYAGFTLTGSTASNGNVNSQTLDAGTYTVKESTQLGWVLTGIGGSSDPNAVYNCTVSGSGGSTGLGDLNTQTASISLKNGDTVTCVFENTGQGVTRTQGFWATHPQLANIAWFGGTAFGHTFPGVVGTAGIGDKLVCGRLIDTLGKLMGAFWSDVSKTSTGAKRSALDQARMQLLQQMVAAELNASAFGSVPGGGSFAAWESAYCGTNTNAIKTAQQQSASFNTAGDSAQFTPGTSADSKNARATANYVFWNVLP